MILASFQVENKQGRAQYFQKTFLLTNVSIKMVLGIFFLTLSNTNIQFAEKKLTWKSYITAKALPTTKRIELIDKKEFAIAALDGNVEALVVHVTSLNLSLMLIHPAREAQIALLLTEKVGIPAKYLNFANVFSKEKAAVLPKRTNLNQYVIELQDSK